LIASSHFILQGKHNKGRFRTISGLVFTPLNAPPLPVAPLKTCTVTTQHALMHQSQLVTQTERQMENDVKNGQQKNGSAMDIDDTQQPRIDEKTAHSITQKLNNMASLSKTPPKQSTANTKTPSSHQTPRSTPISGRRWKSIEAQKHTSLSKCKSIHNKWKLKQLKREQIKHDKELATQMSEEKSQKRNNAKLLKQLRKKQKEENQKKNRFVQVIKNAAKLKKMSKKQMQLAGIEKA